MPRSVDEQLPFLSSDRKATLIRDKEESKLTKEEWKEFTKSVWQIANVSHENHPAVFPQEIPHRLIKLFSMVGEVVLDPFCGTGTTGVAALNLKRHFIGTDSSTVYVKIANRSLSSILAETKFHVSRVDARRLSEIPNGSVDLVITSPPYWNKADYKHNSFNLGCLDKYNKFLAGMRDAFREMYRTVRDGRRVCIVTANVNQYSEHGLLTFPIASDYIKMLQEVGFHIVNEIVWSKDKTGGKWGSFGKQRPIFGSYPYPPHFYFKNIHEYIVIARKSENPTAKGPILHDLFGD